MKILNKNEINFFNLNNINKNEVLIIKNFFSKKLINEKIKNLKKYSAKKKTIRISGKITPFMKNFNRLDLGDYSQVNARACRMLAFFEWNKNLFFSKELKEIISFRDEILNLKKRGYFYYKKKNRYYNLQKFLHYPQGGGFMNLHTDGYNNEGYPNFLLCLTKKGRDYKSGGAYYILSNKKFIEIEDVLEPGDLYAHSINTLHGVNSIDSEKSFDFKNINKGRWALNISVEKI